MNFSDRLNPNPKVMWLSAIAGNATFSNARDESSGCVELRADLDDHLAAPTQVERDGPAAVRTLEATTVADPNALSTTSVCRGFTLRHDELPDFVGANSAPTPLEAVLAALGASHVVSYRAHASILGLRIYSVQVTTRGYADVRGFLACLRGSAKLNQTVEIESLRRPPSEGDWE
ncbi:MAG TPA: hypothetical protein VMT17_12175 [Anaeromyxobacteraceae bacterium]|nr:hypothetical protein [Anaeromyxobacteraceae bacterium]